jgi:hypothetical protein
MKTNALLCAAAFLIVMSVSAASEMSDTTPPQLASLAISPTFVDTSSGSQEIILTIRLTDDLSGVAPGWTFSPIFASAQFRSPVGGLDRPGTLGVSFRGRVSGNELDGVYTGALIVPRFSHAGNWTLEWFQITDAVGNRRNMSYAELHSLGFPTRITVQGTEDRTPPEIISASISPTMVDTSSTNQPITITVRLRDDLAGLEKPEDFFPGSYLDAGIVFVSPSKRHYVSTGFAARTSGDQLDGIYTNSLWLPRYSEPGTWSVYSFSVADAVGNRKTIGLAEFLDRGLPAEFTVQGTGDLSPPEVRALDFSPQRIDTSASSQTIAVTTRLADALSGMGSSLGASAGASATFVSPSKNQSASVGFYSGVRQSGTEFDGVYTNSMVLPRFSETGVWSLRSFSISDAAGNTSQLEFSDVVNLGFPTQFAVGITPSLRITRHADWILLSWPAWASSYSLQSREDLGQSGIWATAGLVPVVLGEDAVVAAPVSAGRTFYRLAERP